MRSSIAYLLVSSLALASNASAAVLQKRQEPAISTHTGTASPSPSPSWTWNAGGSKAWPIHQSCNATEKALLTRGLNEAAALAGHAKDHILRFGNSSEFYQKYFGSAPTGEVIGWLVV